MSGAAPRGTRTAARIVYETPDAVHDEAAGRVARAAEGAVRDRGRFALVLTGGSTVPAVYERLALPPLRDRIDWSATDVFFTDERCVPPDHADSNYGMAQATLLDRVPIPCERIHRMEGEDPNRQRAALAHEARIRQALGLAHGERPRFDLALLGLGADAHVASLFPGHPLIDATDWLVGVVDSRTFDVPSPSVDRLTLTPPALNVAREAVFVVTGEKKAAAVGAVLEGRRDPSRWPAQIVDPPDGAVVWLLDAAAAADLAGEEVS